MFWASDVYSVQDQRSIIQDHYFEINDPIQNHYIYHTHTQALTNNKSNNKFHHSNFVWRIFIVLSSIRPPAQCSGKILQKQQKLNFVKLVFNILLNYLIYFRQFLQLGVIMSDGHVNYSNNTQQTNAWKVHLLTTITWKGIFVVDIFSPSDSWIIYINQVRETLPLLILNFYWCRASMMMKWCCWWWRWWWWWCCGWWRWRWRWRRWWFYYDQVELVLSFYWCPWPWIYIFREIPWECSVGSNNEVSLVPIRLAWLGSPQWTPYSPHKQEILQTWRDKEQQSSALGGVLLLLLFGNTSDKGQGRTMRQRTKLKLTSWRFLKSGTHLDY